MSKFPIDLFRRNIPAAIISLIPESVVWENRVVPVSIDKDGTLVVAMDKHSWDAQVQECELMHKLQPLLRLPVRVVHATKRAIEFALLRYYPSGDHRLA